MGPKIDGFILQTKIDAPKFDVLILQTKFDGPRLTQELTGVCRVNLRIVGRPEYGRAKLLASLDRAGTAAAGLVLQNHLEPSRAFHSPPELCFVGLRVRERVGRVGGAT